MKKFILFFLVFIISCFLIYLASRSISYHKKSHPRISISKLNRLDTLIKSYINKGWESGLVVYIFRNNKVILNKAYGYSNIETGSLMMNNQMFRIMSQTKALTTVAIMILVERGKIYLDEPISDFIPEFKNMNVLYKYNSGDTTFSTIPARREITFKDLLTHKSGINYPVIGSPIARAIYLKLKIPSGLGFNQGSLLNNMKKLAKAPLFSQPGTHWQYGLNMDLLGCLIERISGTTLENFFKEILQHL